MENKLKKESLFNDEVTLELFQRFINLDLSLENFKEFVQIGSRQNEIYNQKSKKEKLSEDGKKSLPFQTFEDMILILLYLVQANHTPDSIRMRQSRVISLIKEEMEKYQKGSFDQKRKLLAIRLNGRNGERIKLSPKAEEFVIEVRQIKKSISVLNNKISKILPNQNV